MKASVLVYNRVKNNENPDSWPLFVKPFVDKKFDFITTPAGCALDFGVTDDGRTLLVEVNDGYSIGSYGVESVEYAKLLSDRLSGLTGTDDETDFEGKQFMKKSYEKIHK